MHVPSFRVKTCIVLIAVNVKLSTFVTQTYMQTDNKEDFDLKDVYTVYHFVGLVWSMCAASNKSDLR